ncbi:MAG: hypothetical protein ACYCW6_07850 [Candidatus Xenobia bacterium]
MDKQPEQKTGLNYVFRIAPPSDAPPAEKVVYVKGRDGKMQAKFLEDSVAEDGKGGAVDGR